MNNPLPNKDILPETKLAVIDNNILHINESLQDIKKQLISLDNRIDSNFKWSANMFFVLIAATVLPTILKLFHLIQ